MKRTACDRFPTLLAWRDYHEFSTREAAEFLQISQSMYSKLERRVRNTRGPVAKRIAERARVPLAVLVGAE